MTLTIFDLQSTSYVYSKARTELINNNYISWVLYESSFGTYDCTTEKKQNPL